MSEETNSDDWSEAGQEIFIVEGLDDIAVQETVRIKGPIAWEGMSGSVIKDEGEFIVVAVAAMDDAGRGFYNVRLPRSLTEKAKA